ncbi:MAG: hydantoinase/oxoprolinase family protein, partial [Alphaproteobacteria bacterium]|nr:hydantoinase/oxoprolinase family protein [Alphaproteobacteria bacterium]
ERSGAMATTKVPSTPDDPGRAFIAAIVRLLQEIGGRPDAVSTIVHGTTIATNAVLQRKLAPTAFVTTAGFGDLLEIARQVRPDPYDVFAEKPKPLVRRDLCLEVGERLAADGSVLVSLDEASIDAVIARLRASDVAAVAICLLHAYRNPEHERRVAARIRAARPDLAVTLSSDLASEFREFPRACTAIVNAGLMPHVSRYLTALDRALGERGVSGERLVMQSNGGISDFAHSAERPVFLIESGPAAGVVGAAHLARAIGEGGVVSFDMGGTTAKIGLVEHGRVHRVNEFEVGADSNRARQWFAGAAGYPILTPAVDLVEIGTGGGSLAWIDDGGQLRVGPVSAGASPGPACYGIGGEQPTITDADLLLGRLDPDFFLGGEMRLDVDAARRAIARVAARLGMDEIACARGIVAIADAAMSQALRVVSVQRGYDPRRFKLIAFGGAGPVHACAIAAEAGIPVVLVPPRPGIASAFGLLVADLKHDYGATRVMRLDAVDAAVAERDFDALAAQGRATLEKEGVVPAQMQFERSVDLRYVGQSYHLSLVLPGGALTSGIIGDLGRRFTELHLATYGYAEAREPIELVALRLSAIGAIGKPPLEKGARGGDLAAARMASRRVFFQPSGFADCAIYDRMRLAEGATFGGPAIVEERDSTTVVPPGWEASVAAHGILALRRLT